MTIIIPPNNISAKVTYNSFIHSKSKNSKYNNTLNSEKNGTKMNLVKCIFEYSTKWLLVDNACTQSKCGKLQPYIPM